MIPVQHRHWKYVWIPIIGAFMWFSTLLAMLLTWVGTGRPHYVSMDPNGHVPYISDIGADMLKPLFITGCVITSVAFFWSLLIERHLRHSGRLMPEMRRRERIFGILAVIGSFIGGCGLILLSVFDTKRHTSLHRLFLLIFMVGVGLSAIFTVIDYRWISKDFLYVRTLKIAYMAKAIIAGILVLLAIAFIVTLYTANDVGGVLEWIIGFGFTLYMLTFYYDLRQSKGIHKGELLGGTIHGRGAPRRGNAVRTHNMRQV